MKTFAIILAAGSGKRLGCKTPKAFIKIKNQEIYKYSLNTFLGIKKIKKIILVVPKKYENKLKFEDKRIVVIAGGKTRNESFEKGINELKFWLKPFDQIIIHDAARIFVNQIDIKKIMKSNFDILSLAYKSNKSNGVDCWLKPYNIQTPQMCRYWLYSYIKFFNKKGKDLFSYFNIVPGSNNIIESSNKENNFKITFKKDLLKAEKIVNCNYLSKQK